MSSRIVELPAQMTLGSYIDALEKLPPAAGVQLSKLFSWRGSYDELSADPDKRNTAADLLADAREALAGAVFYGYKGGEYVMSEYTPIWADPYGTYMKRRLLAVELDRGEVIVTISEEPS